ncbi:MAG: T9SS type A sorting domain-containing protein, partial [Bacteroidetes bacterium]|nr:T9SS type A sorting domain-containing protein [Bacteroidota bacterium]
ISAAAMKSFSTGVIGLIPGAGCYGLVDKIVDPPEAAETWGSWLWNGVSYASSITQCATSFMPGLGQATSLGISLVGMVIDMKDGYDTNEGCWRKFRKKSKTKKKSNGVTSFDPNEIVGPDGFNTDNYISKKGNIGYRIYFENKDTASASALEVFVMDTLDINKFDLNSFSFNTITFGDTTINIQAYAKEFQILVDMYPTKSIIVQVHGVLDTLTGAMSWDFHTLDRVTLELTEDPDLGFLPPNVNYPEGEGNVAYSCKLKETIAHDAIITNRASIVFDFNLPINTNIVSNKIDTIVPVSYVNILSSTQSDTTFTVSWSGSDQGSGIMNYSIFVSDNNNEFIAWKISTNSTSDIFNGTVGHSYQFFCIATDSVGLTEAQKLTHEASTTIVTGIKEANKDVSTFQLFPNPASKTVTFKTENINNAGLVLNIYSVIGELIRSETLLQNQNQINVADLGIGIYMVEIKSIDWSKKQKLIIQR